YEMDPSQGYCFIKGTIGTTPIAPIVLNAPLTNGMFSAMQGIDIVVPIFVVKQQPILLPLKKARITQGTLSADQNCIGHYNSQARDPKKTCTPDTDLFTVGASLDGFITLADANNVPIPQLGNQPLCALLAGQKCTDASGNIVVKGDWCSTTNMPA